MPIAGGALAVYAPSRPELQGADREWLETLVSQGAQALDRAGRYETERGIAETLQRSVLPEQLPTVPGIELAARYLPGTVGVDVGGDWYDAIQLDDGRIGLVVGDVVGKGVQAAAMMGQLRNTLRAFAFERTDPGEVVRRLGKFIEGMLEEAPFATLVYLVVDPRTRGVRYVVAGHPPPLIRAADGTTTFLEGGRALPMGVEASLQFEVGDAQLEPGSTIILYTDGLVERRGRSLDEGLELLSSSSAGSDDDPEELVDTVIAALLGDDERPDDVAILALRFATAVVDDLALVVPTTQEGLVRMRDSLREWLEETRIEADVEAEVMLAAWEACANAVEHAQRPSQPTFGLGAALDDAGWIRVEVQDSGQWKPGDGSTDRGLGLVLMRSLMDTVEVHTGRCRHHGRDGASPRAGGRGLDRCAEGYGYADAAPDQRTGEPHGLHVDAPAVADDVAIVRFRGEADLHTAPILRDALEEAIETGAGTLVVDLTGVTFVDSMMLGVLLGATRRTRPRGTRMRIVVDDPHVRRVFELTLLDRVLELYPSLELRPRRGEPSGG